MPVLILASTILPHVAAAQNRSGGATTEQSLQSLKDRIAEWDSFGWPPRGRFTLSQEALDHYVAFNKRLWNKHGITYMIAPTVMAQFGTQNKKNATANYQHNLLFYWRLFENKSIGKGQFVFNALQVRQLTNTTGVDFSQALGINYFTSDSPADTDALKALYWRQDFPGGYLNIRFGQVELAGINGGCTYACDDTKTFISSPLSANPASTLSGPGMGAIAEFTVGDHVSFEAGFGDGNGDGTLNPGRPFRTGELAYVAAVVLRDPFAELGAGQYRLSGYYVDPTKQGTTAAAASTRGVALHIDQDIGDFGLFAKYSRAFGRLGSVRQTGGAGIAWNNPFGNSEDTLGVGLGWVDPTAANTRDEFVAETYYRLQLTPLVTMSADAMLILNPSNNKNSNTEAVFTLRARAHF